MKAPREIRRIASQSRVEPGGLADDRRVGLEHAVFGQPAGAARGALLLVGGEREDEIARDLLLGHGGAGIDHRRDRALHVGRSQPVQMTVTHHRFPRR